MGSIITLDDIKKDINLVMDVESPTIDMQIYVIVKDYAKIYMLKEFHEEAMLYALRNLDMYQIETLCMCKDINRYSDKCKMSLVKNADCMYNIADPTKEMVDLHDALYNL